MKVVALLALAFSATAEVEGKSTITKVVKLLQDMLDKSVNEGDTERKIFAKFKCYCDTSEAEKTTSIKDETESIALLESQIEELQGDTGGLSSECADLKAAMADNKDAQDEADTLRNKENKAFKAEKADLEQAIGQMKSAIETLNKVGADQTSATGADNKQFMAGKSSAFLQDVQTEVGHALRAASALLSPDQQETATAFLQGPFTGTYTSQSAVVMGIIKSMRDTFKKNREDAIRTEADALKAFDAFMDNKRQEHKEMKASYQSKQKALGGNDGDLSSKRKQLSDSEKQLASDEDFLSKLRPKCEEKTKSYGVRKMLRASEEAAIAEAISILNSDDAFASFGTTSATSTGATGFIQLRAVHRHVGGTTDVRRMAQNVLQAGAHDAKSARLSKVVALLQAENPFDEVLGEIEKMVTLIGEEGDADQKKLDWCNEERTTNDATVTKKKKEILSLNRLINKLENTIENEETGLKKQIADTETNLEENRESQKTETAERTEDNLAYQQDVKNLVKAQSILDKAIRVLKAYYEDLEGKLADGNAFLQQKKEDPKNADGETWKENSYGGQSDTGNKVLNMLGFILDETNKEEMKAHSEEKNAQHAFEDSMTDMTKKEKEAEKAIVDLSEELAEKEEELLKANEDLKDTTDDKEETEDYLAKIKPGCDFITSNFDTREKNRATEKKALNKATGLIKGTPAYKTAVNAATSESYGDCKEPCEKDEAHLNCKACMADVTKPAYCAGHKGTKGC